MPVNTPSSEYETAKRKWERCRDAYDGGDAIKKKGELYLPPLGSHAPNGTFTTEGQYRYLAYKDRALWYNATGRTVDGLAGGIFQKSPKIVAPNVVTKALADVTLTNQPVELFALQQAKEVLTVGRAGILVDMSDRPGMARPYWAAYRAEDIISYRAISIDGDEVLTRVVLCETVSVDDPKDPFVQKESQQYRVLELSEAGVYSQTEWTAKAPGSNEWVASAPKIAERRGSPLNFIPFVFLGPTSISPAIPKPPLDDLVLVNISHYRNMADLEHGRHFVALPTPWISGASKPEGPVTIGSESAWFLGADGSAGMLEFTGQGLGALENADQQKRHMMAVLGARLLEEQGTKSNVNETAAAVGMRHAGEQATLKTLAQSLETGFTLALQWHSWWVGTEDAPADTGAVFELNKEFSTLRMAPEQLRALVEALQANAISDETFYHNLEDGGLARPGVPFDEEQKDIEAKAGAGGLPDEPLVVGNPYMILKRKGKYVVVNSDTGKPVPGGVHPTLMRAKKHHAALEANVKE